MSTKNKRATPKVKPDPEPAAEPAGLRRSSRTTRGSIKPVVDLTQDIEVVSSEEVDQVAVKREPIRRSSTTKREPAKKESVKRGTTKRAVAKQELAISNTKVNEEEEDEVNQERLDKVEEECEVSYELDEREMKEINHAFDMNRLGDNDEYLNTDGLRTAIRSLGFEPRGDEIKRLMKKYTKGNKVNRDGFHRLMAFKLSTTPALKGANGNGTDEISRVFNLLDLDKTGLITLDNLKSIAKELNEDLEEAELREMIEEADQDNDFMINKYEFENIMKKISLY